MNSTQLKPIVKFQLQPQSNATTPLVTGSVTTIPNTPTKSNTPTTPNATTPTTPTKPIEIKRKTKTKTETKTETKTKSNPKTDEFKNKIREKINKRKELFRVPLGKSKKILKKNGARVSKIANIQNSILIEILIDQFVQDMIENEKQLKKEKEDFNLKYNPDVKKKEGVTDSDSSDNGSDKKDAVAENQNLTFQSLVALKDKEFITSRILKLVDFENATGRFESNLMIDRKRFIRLHRMENKRKRKREEKIEKKRSL
jgi:hypothetical protein